MNCPICLEKKSVSFSTLNAECVCKISNATHQQFSSHSPLFLSKTVVDKIKERIVILEKLIHSQPFKDATHQGTEGSPSGGILMSYDFHLLNDVPKLIEINTNAGGFFINYEMLQGLDRCCEGASTYDPIIVEKQILEMFRNELAKTQTRELRTVAIMDENPTEQFLYPEFLICKSILEKHGIQVFIVDPKEIEMNDGVALVSGTSIDLIYNRVTDFYFTKAEHAHLRALTQGATTVVSPGPEDYKLFADKSNFLHLQDKDVQETVLTEGESGILRETIPETFRVREDNADTLWEKRKRYFFKPLNGYGGKGAYNGKGLTKKVWEEIKTSQYIAQEIIQPSTKEKENNGEIESFKYDIRAYTYRGEVLLLCARLYQGQTTNFRTPGGGFAPVFITTNK